MVDVADKTIEDVKLTDLIEVDVLQRVQDVFSAMARMAAHTTDEFGVPITKSSNYSELCTEFCRKSPEGRKRCEHCDRMGAVTAMEQKESVFYYCHANLVDFAAPILLNGRMIGSLIGGQVLPNKPNLEKMRKVAREIDVDEDAFVAAAEKIQVIPMAAIERSTKFIYGYAEVLSEMAYTTYVARKMSREALRAASAKADFLATMSHEIRTPLNAIIGMSQIAIREEMSDVARKSIDQIMNSGKMLLTIINDILDYSKIESGKMTFVESEYDMLVLVRDVVEIIANRIGDKNVELIIDVDPSIPQWLCGDSMRIKQILVNLANNAVKFTNEGFVALRISYKWTASDKIILNCSVQDTGIGIKKEAFNKLFDSFEQVDSKRNREIEGTGLGLAIVKNLVGLMKGSVKVESEYGKGSIFSVSIPQKVVDGHACITPIGDCPCVVGFVKNPYLKAELHKDVERIGAMYVDAGSVEQLGELLRQVEAKFLFVSEDLFTKELQDYVLALKDLTVIRFVELNNDTYKDIPGIKTIKKPLYSMNVAALLKNTQLEVSSETESEVIDFMAPDACVLVVDDNEVNLTVATGLLEPLQMQMDTALSGKEAIEMISSKQYDLVFMDHMMPELDGVETTHIIRRMYPTYDNVPIIALTANAVRGTREMLLDEGMNDFIAKPIELNIILAKLRKYLPSGKIKEYDPALVQHEAAKKQEDGENTEEFPIIPELDMEYSLKLLGSPKLFYKVLKDYYRVIDDKFAKIEDCEGREDWEAYRIEVHALKSASRQIGALPLADKAEQLEEAGRQKQADVIHEKTGDLLADYRHLQNILAPYCMEEKKTNTVQIPVDTLKQYLEDIHTAMENLDLGAADDLLAGMDQYAYEGGQEELFARLKSAIEDIDTEMAENVLEEWKNAI